jgi:hypothetical protein
LILTDSVAFARFATVVRESIKVVSTLVTFHTNDARFAEALPSLGVASLVQGPDRVALASFAALSSRQMKKKFKKN